MRVCIIGTGLSALTLAKALVKENIYVDLVFLNKKNKINLSRTIGISKSNFEYVNSNIINIKKIAWKLQKIEIFSDNLKNENILNFKNNEDHLFSIIKNYKFYEILNKSLLSSNYCKIMKFKNNIKNYKKYNLIINTDYFCPFTKKYFYQKVFKKYNSFAYTTLIKHKKIRNTTATQIFTKIGPLAFLPISESQTSVVYSIDNSLKKNNKNIVDLIKEYNFRYEIQSIEKIDVVELQSSILRSYYHGKILAFGDLLHKIHPLAGQGFNMTIRDINVLVDVIKEKISLGLPLDVSVNESFEKKLRHKNYLFSNSIDLIHKFFNIEKELKNNILTNSVKLLGTNSSIKKIFTKIADKGF